MSDKHHSFIGKPGQDGDSCAICHQDFRDQIHRCRNEREPVYPPLSSDGSLLREKDLDTTTQNLTEEHIDFFRDDKEIADRLHNVIHRAAERVRENYEHRFSTLIASGELIVKSELVEWLEQYNNPGVVRLILDHINKKP